MDARFHRAALGANRKTTHLAARVDGPYGALKAARNATEDAEELSTDAFARLTLADFELDEACRLAELDALGAVGKDRKSVEYRGCLGEISLSDLVALRGAEQEAAVKTLVEALLIHLPDVHGRHGEGLLALAATATSAELAWLEAERLVGAAFAAERIARLQVVRQLQKDEGALTEIFPGQRRRVRSFYRGGKPRAVVEQADTDVDDDDEA